MYFIKQLSITPTKYYAITYTIHNEPHMCFVGFKHEHTAKQVMDSLLTFKKKHKRLPSNDGLYVLHEKHIQLADEHDAEFYEVENINLKFMGRHNSTIFYVQNIETNNLKDDEYSIRYNILNMSVNIDIMQESLDNLFNNNT